MARKYRIVAEGPVEALTPAAALAHAREAEPFVNGDAPFVEVGGPKPVYQSPPLSQTPPPKQSPREYLSVSLQSVTTKSPASPFAVASDIVAFHAPDHAVSEEYRRLAADISRQLVGTGSKAILITGLDHDRGTTTVLLNLGVTLARQDSGKVLLVDTAIGHASAARKMGLGEVPGLAEVLAEETPLAWALQPSALANLQVLAAGHGTLDSFADWPTVLAQLRQWYDWILIDGGVWGENADRDAACPAYDAVYLVARQNETAAISARHAISRQGGLLRGFITTQL